MCTEARKQGNHLTIILTWLPPYNNNMSVADSIGLALVPMMTKQYSILKKNQNAPRPSEHPPARQGEKMSKRLGGIIDCKYKTSSWHLNGFLHGSNIGSRV